MDPNSVQYQVGGPTGPPPAKRTSPWVYVGCGCALVLLIGALAMFFIGKGVFDRVQTMKEDMSNPQKREQRTREMLGYRTLPDGYYAGGALSIPLISDMAFLTDRQPDGTAASRRSANPIDFDQHGFMYMTVKLGRLPAGEDARKRMLDKKGQSSPWNNGTVRMESDAVVSEGQLQAGGARIYYRAVRGDTYTNRDRHHGVATQMVVACPDDRLRFAFWFGPDPGPDVSSSSLETSGTTADPKAITAFLDHFSLCGAS